MRILLPLALLALAASSQAVTLAVWNFNDASPAQANLFAVDRTNAAIASAAMSTTFPTTNVTTGSTVNADGSDVAGNALVLPDGPSASFNNGKSLTFSLTKKAGVTLSGLAVSFATRKTVGGFNDNQFAYSTDGATFTDFATYGSTLTNTSFAVQSFDLSGVSALNSATTLTFRITLKGATTPSNTTGNAIDNLVVSGAVPEPASLVALGLGAAALLRRRKRA